MLSENKKKTKFLIYKSYQKYKVLLVLCVFNSMHLLVLCPALVYSNEEIVPGDMMLFILLFVFFETHSLIDSAHPILSAKSKFVTEKL